MRKHSRHANIGLFVFAWIFRTSWQGHRQGAGGAESPEMLEGGQQHWGLGARAAVQRANLGLAVTAKHTALHFRACVKIAMSTGHPWATQILASATLGLCPVTPVIVVYLSSQNSQNRPKMSLLLDISMLKTFQLQWASPSDPLTRVSAPGFCWGLRPRPPL